MTFSCLDEAFASAMQMKKWLRNCAAVALKLKQPIRWETPLGLPVVQPYMRRVVGSNSNKQCLLPVRKQISAFPPNFIHSLDATHMMLAALACLRKGLTFAAVHDCFWTHACDVDEMSVLCREQFIALHRLPIAQDLSSVGALEVVSSVVQCYAI